MWTFQQEGSKWNGYKIWLSDMTETRSHNDFFAEYKMAKAAMDYAVRNQTRDGDLIKKQNYVDNIITIARASMFGLQKRSPTQSAIKTLTDSVYDSSQGQQKRVKVEKDILFRQANILLYMGDGEWQSKRYEYGDRIYLFRFGKEKHLPMLWFILSMNEHGKYLRLHGWSRSILTPYLLKLYTENEKVPAAIGTFALAWLIHIVRYKRQRLYGEFLTGSIKVLQKMDPTTQVKSVPKELEDDAGGEPQYVELTRELTHAHLEPFVQDAPVLLDAPIFPRDIWLDMITKYEIFSVSDITQLCQTLQICNGDDIWRRVLLHETIPSQPVREILQRVLPKDYKMQVIVNRIYKHPLTDDSKETRGWKFASGDRIMMMLKYVRGFAQMDVTNHLYPAQSVDTTRIHGQLVAFTQSLEDLPERIEAVIRFIAWKIESKDSFDRCERALCNNHVCTNEAKYTCGGPQFKYCSMDCAKQDYTCGSH